MMNILLPISVGSPAQDSRPRVVDASGAVLCIIYRGGNELADLIARKVSEAVTQQRDQPVGQTQCTIYGEHVFWMSTKNARLLVCDCGAQQLSGAV